MAQNTRRATPADHARASTGQPSGPFLLQPCSSALDRELADLERRKLVALSAGSVRLTREGYLELSRRFPRRR